MRRAAIITNPAAARVNDAGLAAACARLVRGGLAVDVLRTTVPGHGEQLARAAVADGYDVLIAHGGDGTVMEVVAALVGTGRPLGLLPAGTGNLLAGNLGIRRAPRAAADVILHGTPRTIDVGHLETAATRRYFTVAAGAGFDAELMYRTPARHKRRFGVGAYVATAFGLATAITRAAVRVETDQVTLETRAATVLVANCRELIPGVLPLGPAIAPDDGVLDVAILDAQSFPSAARVAWRLLLRQGHRDPGVTFLRAHTVTITADTDLLVQADGEFCGHAPVSVRVVPGALAVLAPGRA